MIRQTIKEFLIWSYLLFFKVFFKVFSMFPIKKQFTFVISFGDNAEYIYEEIQRRRMDVKTVFLYKRSCMLDLNKYPKVKKVKFETTNLFSELKSIYYLATSKCVIIDNYYAFLSCINFKKGVECIQIWHAVGAFKKFGLEDQSIVTRSERDHKRFLEVYKRFHKVIVGSDEMAEIFKKAFNLTSNNILRTGIPRTDLFYNEEKKQAAMERLNKIYPQIRNKKVILYAPTFRDDKLSSAELNLNIELMYQELREDYVLLLRLHPSIKKKINLDSLYGGFVYDTSTNKDVNELLLITDILITDYSSIPFEFAILKRPIIFYTYDLIEYGSKRGLLNNFEKTLPGPIVYSTNELIEHVKLDSFDLTSIYKFAHRWNKYSQGNSSSKIVDYLQKKTINHI